MTDETDKTDDTTGLDLEGVTVHPQRPTTPIEEFPETDDDRSTTVQEGEQDE